MHVQRGGLGIDREVVDAGFLGRFAQRRRDNVGVGLLAVAAELELSADPRMQRQQCVGAAVVED